MFILLSETQRPPSKRRKRKSSATNNANSTGTGSGKKKNMSPGPPNFSLASQVCFKYLIV